MISAHDSAQIALGKFYLHRWEGQVLVDWATSMISQGYDGDGFIALSEMEGHNRAELLDQFIQTCLEADIEVVENLELSIRAYIEDLRRRALAQEIEVSAAFAQLRPLAYDNTSVVIPGLTALDEDFNLLDSKQAPFHHTAMTPDNREEYLIRFFEALTIEDGPWNQPKPTSAASEPHRPNTFEQETYRYVEMVVVILITLLFTLYMLMLLASVMTSGLPPF